MCRGRGNDLYMRGLISKRLVYIIQPAQITALSPFVSDIVFPAKLAVMLENSLSKLAGGCRCSTKVCFVKLTKTRDAAHHLRI